MYSYIGAVDIAKLDQEIYRVIFNKNMMLNISTIIGDGDKPVSNIEKQSFFFFLDMFGDTICGYKNYSDYYKQIYIFQERCTVSDEAIVLFFLEKNWDKWAEGVYDMESNVEESLKIMQQHGVEACPQQIVFTKKHSNKKFGGWTHGAIERFTDIARKVASARDRKERKVVEQEYMQYRRSKNTKFKSLMDGSDDDENLDEQVKRAPPVAYNELYDSSDEEHITTDITPLSSQEDSPDLLG